MIVSLRQSGNRSQYVCVFFFDPSGMGQLLSMLRFGANEILNASDGDGGALTDEAIEQLIDRTVKAKSNGHAYANGHTNGHIKQQNSKTTGTTTIDTALTEHDASSFDVEEAATSSRTFEGKTWEKKEGKMGQLG